jgi:isoquinoline 1-oxidoreductase beta subunit
MFRVRNVSRRSFLVAGAVGSAGLILAFHLGQRLDLPPPSGPGTFSPSVWLQINPEGRVVIWVAKTEFGQGIHTALPMLVAEELDADWDRVEIRHAPTSLLFGDQETIGSLSVRQAWLPLRKAGATARAMLLTAAAAAWNVDSSSCRAGLGVVEHIPSGRRLTYGELAGPASRLSVPSNVSLKDPKDFSLIGRSVRRVDVLSKTTGSANFGIDVRVPEMLFAAVLRSPVLGGRIRSFDGARAKEVAGVREVRRISSGIAVVADSSWAAFRGKQAIQAEWESGGNDQLSSAGIEEKLDRLGSQPGAVAHKVGDFEAAFAGSAIKLDVTYKAPFLAHVTMEPMNCTADVHWDRCEIWAPTQHPELFRQAAARMCRLPGRRVNVHATLAGGAFGRRLELDVLADPIELSRAVGRPVQVVWTREDDIQHDYYRPISHMRMRGGLDSAGRVTAWAHRVVAPSIRERFGPLKNGYDNMALEGAEDVSYEFSACLVDYVSLKLPVPIGNWRSVNRASNAFAGECFLDELAAAAKRDPIELRMELLRGLPRHRAVLALAAEKDGWREKLAPGRGRGISVHRAYDSIVALVCHVVVGKDGSLRVPRIVCAADCGIVINPDIVQAQLEGGIAQGLSAALKEEIKIERGRISHDNFHNYDVLRIGEMPVVEIYLISSEEKPGGVGELGVPPVAPSLANAIFVATGKRIRRLPIRPADVLAA